MRLIGFYSFLGLPKGTLYAEYASPGEVGRICIKGETIDRDFLYRPLIQLEEGDNNFYLLWKQAERDEGLELPLNTNWEEMDMFGNDFWKFVVFSNFDVQSLMNGLIQGIITPGS